MDYDDYLGVLGVLSEDMFEKVPRFTSGAQFSGPTCLYDQFVIMSSCSWLKQV